MIRYSTLPSGKMCDLAATIMQMGCEAHEFTVLIFDPDGAGEYPITGFVIDPEKKTISLHCDSDEESAEPSTPVAAQGGTQETTKEKEYEFDRYRDGKLMAEGARVRAQSLSEALSKAKALFTRSAEWGERDSLCVAASQQENK